MDRRADAALPGELRRKLVRFRPKLLLASLLSGLVAALFIFAWGYQVRNGIGVAGINRPVFWGFYITNFVFWIGISHAGTLISAILRVTGAEWRRPVTRCAEAITVFALAIGGLFPIIHLGRPLKVLFMLPLPNERGLWPNFRSPLIWDLAAITAYVLGSMIYLYLPLIPDMAILRDKAKGRIRIFYAALALGWRGSTRQWHSLEAGIKVMAVVIIPLAVSVHTIVSWDFAMTQTPMWNSTIFGPYFVVGAIYSGIAMLLIAMTLLRGGLDLGQWLSLSVFNNLGLLFLAMAMFWGYFTFAENLTVWYANEPAEASWSACGSSASSSSSRVCRYRASHTRSESTPPPGSSWRSPSDPWVRSSFSISPSPNWHRLFRSGRFAKAKRSLIRAAPVARQRSPPTRPPPGMRPEVTRSRPPSRVSRSWLRLSTSWPKCWTWIRSAGRSHKPKAACPCPPIHMIATRLAPFE